MTARKSGSRLETEIERCRSECQWDKIPELVRQLSAKLISNGKKHLTFLSGPSFNLEGLSPGLSPLYFLTATAGTGSFVLVILSYKHCLDGICTIHIYIYPNECTLITMLHCRRPD